MADAIVLVSGGVDSAVALWHSVHRGLKVIPLSVDYHERPKAEKVAVRRLLAKAGLGTLIEVPLGFMKEVGDLGSGRGVNPFLRDAPKSYIPARNMVFYSIAAYYAEVAGADLIVGGHNQEDPEEFPDSNARFFGQVNRLLETGLWSYRTRPVRIELPLRGKTKVEVLRMGLRLGVPLELTWSCHRDGKRHCGRCSSCIERRKAFAKAGVDDPALGGKAK